MRRYNPLKEWLDARATGTPGGYALRGLVLALGLVLAASVWFLLGGAPGWSWLVVLVLLGGAWATVNPDGPGPMIALVSTLAAWWFGGWGHPWWQGGMVGLVAVAFHMVCAWAAFGPLHSASTGRLRRRLVRCAAAVLGGSVVAVGLVGAGLVLPVASASAGWLVAAGVLLLVGVGALLVVRRDPPPPLA